jgi:hypothetical protein
MGPLGAAALSAIERRDDLVQAVLRQGKTIGPLALDVGGEAYLAYLLPIRSSSDQLVGAAVALRSRDRELAAFRETRISRAEEIVARLNALQVPVTFDAVLAEAGEGAVGRPHVARAIVRGGWVRDQRESFDRFLGNGRPAFVPKHHLEIGDAIRLVHDAGGVAVVAHPGGDGTRARIEPLVALGLDGLEVRHPSHSAEDNARLGALVDHFGLVPSGGSDWHGAVEGPRVIGNQRVSADWAERQQARAVEVRAAHRAA